MSQKMEISAATLCTQNGTKIPQPLTGAQQHLKQDGDSRPKLAMIDGNCKTTTKLDDSKKLASFSTERTGMSMKVAQEGRTKENKRPSQNLSCADTTTISLNTTSRSSKRKPIVRLSRLKPPKILDTTKVELSSLGPDCQPDLNSIPQLYMADGPDMNDSDDPQQCTAYIHNIYQSLLCAEKQNSFRISQDLLSQQREVNTNHRTLLVNWMVAVHEQFKLSLDTLHISVDILDRYLQKMPVTKKKLQLVGITAMFIAAKYEEIYHPSISEFVYISSGLYSMEQIREMEIRVLRTLEYQLGKPNPLTFLRRYSKLLMTTTHVHNLAKYFIEACYLSTDCRSLLPSQLAVGALLLAATAVQGNLKQLWGPIMQKYTWYSNKRASMFMTEVVRQMKIYFKLLSSKSAAVKEKYSEGYYNVASLPWLQDTINNFTLHS